ESMSVSGNIELNILQEELKKIKKQEKRYGLAYANDAISVEELKQFLSPLRDRRTEVTTSMGLVKSQAETDSDKFPKISDIEKFTSCAKKTLMNLDFNAKRNIVLKVVDRVAITGNQLAVFGHIPMDDGFELCSNGRNGVNTMRQTKIAASIPFEININLN
ncbi:MAG: recombinase family protein, partial [Flavipsychrobacter sp.]|nr:recombinase family protein [Flavipsychrobacter sp.]